MDASAVEKPAKRDGYGNFNIEEDTGEDKWETLKAQIKGS